MTRLLLLRLLGDVIGRLVAIIWFGFFLKAHLEGYLATGKLSLALFAASETLLVFLFVVRRRGSVSWHPVDAVAAFAGTAVILLYRPSGDPAHWLGEALVAVGVLGQLGGIGSLGRSFGILPAHRGLRTTGAYRLVRHPIYASYLLSYVGYLLSNPTGRNLGILLAAFSCQIVRVLREERWLSRDPAYRDYQGEVRWRLVPGLF